MEERDIDAVVAIEHVAFEQSWPATAFAQELRGNRAARYVVCEVAEGEGSPRIVGFAGLWLQFDQAHVVTVAVPPEERRHGYGRLLVHALLLVAESLGMTDATLEVRASNVAARGLYRRYGFHEVGERKRYYADNGEDAVIMTTEGFASAGHRERMDRLRSVLDERFPGALERLDVCES
jgi:ribosomal-protein-alanine N-acetyltransferase